ncbi:MAG: Clp1/GlmU family protein [Acidimicrobiia bacterium]|nr:Clp1/GlmU family protein [Acidimicrobiia bacterium]
MRDDAPFASIRDRIDDLSGVVMMIGEADTGKTTLAKLIAADAIKAGRTVGFVDGDVAAATVGPATCVGLKVIRDASDLDALSVPDELRFVGSIEPHGVVLPHVVAVSALVDIAQREADLVVLDTSGVVAGVVGQTLKYHIAELTHPSLVVALGRGAELEPVVGMLRRFLSLRVAEAEPPDDLVLRGPVERQEERVEAFVADLGVDPPKWRVQTTVFAPTLPLGFDVSRLDGMLVGVQDERGRCKGLGILEHADGTVRVATQHGDEMRGLRLGSLRVDPATFATSRVRLRELIFGV